MIEIIEDTSNGFCAFHRFHCDHLSCKITKIGSIKTTSVENVSIGVLEKIRRDISEVKIKPENDMLYQSIYNCTCQNTKKIALVTFVHDVLCIIVTFFFIQFWYKRRPWIKFDYINYVLIRIEYLYASARCKKSSGESFLPACSCADQRNHQSFAPLAFARGIQLWPVDSPHKGPVTRKMFPFDDVIMKSLIIGS